MNENRKTTHLTISVIALQYAAAVLVMIFLTTEMSFTVEFLINVLFYILIFIVPIFIFIRKALNVNPLAYLQLQGRTREIGIGFIIAIIMAFIFLITNQFVITVSTWDVSAMLGLVGAMLAGLFEEIIFRGFYLHFFKTKFGFIGANLITAFLFSALHFQYIAQQNFIQLVILFVLGLFLGYVYEKTKSLWVPIIIHITFNILIFLFR